MMRIVVPFLGAFGASLLLGLATSSCGGGDCDCLPTPERPEPSDPLPLAETISFDDQGEPGATDVQPESGSLEITGDQVVIRYEQEGAQLEVVYGIVGPG
jgi:hypothetical protein